MGAHFRRLHCNKFDSAGVHWGMQARLFQGLGAILALVALLAHAEDEVRFDFEQSVAPFHGMRIPPPSDDNVREVPTPMLGFSPGAARGGRGVLCFRFERRKDSFEFLRAGVDLAGLQQIEFDIKAAQKCAIGLLVEDSDGAKFNHVFQLAQDTWRKVQASPANFKLSDDSPAKKDRLDPACLRLGLSLIDLSVLVGMKEGANALWIDNFSVRRALPPNTKRNWNVTQDTVLTEAVRIEGELTIAKGATLTVRGTRVDLSAKVLVHSEAVLRFEKAVVSVPSVFPYEHGIELRYGAKLETRDTKLLLAKPWLVNLASGSQWEASGTEFSHRNLTANVRRGARLLFDGVSTPGELVIEPGAKAQLLKCRGFLIWLRTDPEAKGRITFPDGVEVKAWRAPEAFELDVAIQEGREVLWGLLAADRTSIEIPGAKLRTLGLAFTDSGARSIRGFQNKKAYGREPLEAGAIRLALEGSSIQTWNFYTARSANLNVTACTFGEALAFDDSEIVIEQSVCDGSGGYVGSMDRAKIEARQCRFTCPVVARGDSQLTLIDCEVSGDVIAADRGKLTLVRCRISGAKRVQPGAKLTEK